MKVGIVGVGAIGGWVAAHLARAGHDVACLARGKTLESLRARGLVLVDGGERTAIAVKASASAAELGPQDVVVVAVKAPSLGSAAADARPLVASHTTIVPMMNGVPWWFVLEPRLETLDPDGAIAAAFPAAQIVGSVVHAACTSPEPGLVEVKRTDRLLFGEPDGASSPRVVELASAMEAAGLPAVVSPRIRQEIWYKLWGNMTMNPISAVARATCDRILDDELVAAFALRVMAEAAAVGDAIGCRVEETGEARNAVTRKLGAFRTSMLQDIEAGRPLELAAMLGAPREIARRHGIATPNMDALHGLARLTAQSFSTRA